MTEIKCVEEVSGGDVNGGGKLWILVGRSVEWCLEGMVIVCVS